MRSCADGTRMTDIQKEVAFFDAFAEQGDYDVLAEKAYERLLSFFRDLAHPKPGDTAIDLGCGSGALTRRLRPFSLGVTGMDISSGLIKRAKEQATTETYAVGDIRSTGFPDASFDHVLYSGVLHHFDTRTSRVETLREGFRILKPGGHLWAFDPNLHSPSMWLYRDPRSPLFSEEGKTENEVLLTRAMLTSEINEAGFRSVAVRGVSGTPFRYVAGRFARVILPAYNVYEQVIRFSGFERALGTFLVSVARKPGAGDS